MSSSSEIKAQLLFVLNKIDEAIRQYKEKANHENILKQQEDLMNENSPNFFVKITSIKSQVESLQKILEEIYNIDKINKLESDIKKKEKLIKELKVERHILNNIVKEQNKGINEFLSKFNSSKEQKNLSEQIKIVKDENHKNKELYKDITNRIKTQINEIDTLEKKCLIIKQNIEFQKKKQVKAEKKTFKEEKENWDIKEFGENLEEMEEAEKNIINAINIEEKNYRIEINEQNEIIKKINIDINKIDLKIKNLIQEKNLDKNKKKNKIRGRSATNIQKNKNSTKNLQSRGNKRNLSSCKQRTKINNNNNLKNNKIINTEKITMIRNPNYNFKKNDKITKPFEIEKFNGFSKTKRSLINEGKNYTTMFNENKTLKLASFNDNVENKTINIPKNKNKKFKGAIILKEIESLKSEIQNTLKNNVVILNENENAKNIIKYNYIGKTIF